MPRDQGLQAALETALSENLRLRDEVEQLRGILARHSSSLPESEDKDPGSAGELPEVSEVARFPDGVPRVILATGSYIGEGFDDSRLDALFPTMPISWRGTLQQYVGRLHRVHDGKKVVRVYDYVDAQVPMLARMYEKRLRGYHAIGYELAAELENDSDLQLRTV